MIPILALIILGCLAYSNCFFNFFHLDDYAFIVNNPAIRDFHHLADIWASEPTRFLTTFSFVLNYHWGGLNPVGYHIVSLLLHLATTLMFWQLMLLLTEDAWISFLGAAIFLLHPLQTQAVNYIYQRGVLFTAFFYISSLVFFIKSNRPKGQYYYVASLFCMVLSLFSKENAVTLPVMMLLYQWIWVKPKEIKGPKIWPFFLTLFILPLVWLAPRLSHIKDFLHGTSNGISPIIYALTQSKVILTYLKLLIIPVHQRIEYDYSLVNGFDMSVSLSLIVILGLIAIGFLIRERFKLISFGIFWFFLTLLPESSFWPNNDVIYEHRVYLPLAGFAFFLSGLIFALFKDKQRSMGIRILLIVLAIYGGLTYQRNKVWHDELSLWDNTVQESPKSWRAYLNRGAAYQNLGDLPHAMADYNMIIALGRLDPIGLSNRGLIFAKWGQFDLAMANYNLAIHIEPSYMGAYNNRGLLYAEEGQTDLALADLNIAMQQIRDNAWLYRSRGLLYRSKGENELAIQDFEQAQRLIPNEPEFRELIAETPHS